MVKEQQFIKGAWYKLYNNELKRYTYYIKFRKISGNYIDSSEFINYDYHNHSICNSSDNIDKFTLHETCISEIAKYLPKNHPDLLFSNNFSNIEIW